MTPIGTHHSSSFMLPCPGDPTLLLYSGLDSVDSWTQSMIVSVLSVLSYLTLLALFPFSNSGFLAATFPQRPFLIELVPTRSTWYPDEAVSCWVRSFWISSGLSKWNSEKFLIRFWKVSQPHTHFFFISVTFCECEWCDWRLMSVQWYLVGLHVMVKLQTTECN